MPTAVLTPASHEQVYSLPPDRLYASYFGGDEALGLQPDNEARQYW